MNILVQILSKIFGKKKKKPTENVNVKVTLPSEAIKDITKPVFEMPIVIDPVTGEVIKESAFADTIKIEFDKQIDLLKKQLTAFINLRRLRQDNYALMTVNMPGRGKLSDEQKTAILKDEMDKQNAIILETKVIAKKIVDLYNEQSNYQAKLLMKAIYDNVRKFFVGVYPLAETYDTLANEGFNLLAPVKPVSGTGGGSSATSDTVIRTADGTVKILHANGDVTINGIRYLKGSTIATVGTNLPTTGELNPTPTTTTTPTNNTPYPTWSDQLYYYPNQIIWYNGYIFKILTPLDRNVKPSLTDGRFQKL